MALALAAGSALGGMARFWVVTSLDEKYGLTHDSNATLPWGTLVVNLSGAFAAGWVGALITADQIEGWVTVFLLAGFLGSYTTVSALSLHTLLLAQQGRLRAALGNVTLTLLFGLAAVGTGFALGCVIHV